MRYFEANMGCCFSKQNNRQSESARDSTVPSYANPMTPKDQTKQVLKEKDEPSVKQGSIRKKGYLVKNWAVKQFVAEKGILHRIRKTVKCNFER